MGLFLAKHHFVVVINYPVGSAVRTTDVPILNISGLYNAVLWCNKRKFWFLVLTCSCIHWFKVIHLRQPISQITIESTYRITYPTIRTGSRTGQRLRSSTQIGNLITSVRQIEPEIVIYISDLITPWQIKFPSFDINLTKIDITYVTTGNPDNSRNIGTNQCINIFFLIPIKVHIQSIVQKTKVYSEIKHADGFPLDVGITDFVLPKSHNRCIRSSDRIRLFGYDRWQVGVVITGNVLISQLTPGSTQLTRAQYRSSELHEFFTWEVPSCREWWKISPTIALGKSWSSVGTQVSSKQVFTVKSIVDTTKVRTQSPLVFCSAIHKINHSGTNNVNILNHHIITRSPQRTSIFPLLRKSQQCSQLVASYGLIKVQGELQRLGHNVKMALWDIVLGIFICFQRATVRVIRQHLRVKLIHLAGIYISRVLHTYVQSVYNFEICIENTIEHTSFPFFHSRLIGYLQGVTYRTVRPVLTIYHPAILVRNLPHDGK